MGQDIFEQSNVRSTDRQKNGKAGRITYIDASFSSRSVQYMLDSIRENCNDNWKNIYHDIFAILNIAISLAALAIYLDSVNTILLYCGLPNGLFGDIHSPLASWYIAFYKFVIPTNMEIENSMFWLFHMPITLLVVVIIKEIPKKILSMVRNCFIKWKLIIPYPYSRKEEESIIQNYEEMEKFESYISVIRDEDYTITMSASKDKLRVEYSRNGIGFEKEFCFIWKDGNHCALLDYKNAVVDFGRMDAYYGFNRGFGEM